MLRKGFSEAETHTSDRGDHKQKKEKADKSLPMDGSLELGVEKGSREICVSGVGEAMSQQLRRKALL